MKSIIFSAMSIILFSSSAAFAGHVNGYTRSNGTYVQGYERSAPDNTVTNNYSFQGNTNPATGAIGTNNYSHDTTSPYYDGTPDSNGNTGHSGLGTYR